MHLSVILISTCQALLTFAEWTAGTAVVCFVVVGLAIGIGGLRQLEGSAPLIRDREG